MTVFTQIVDMGISVQEIPTLGNILINLGHLSQTWVFVQPTLERLYPMDEFAYHLPKVGYFYIFLKNAEMFDLVTLVILTSRYVRIRIPPPEDRLQRQHSVVHHFMGGYLKSVPVQVSYPPRGINSLMAVVTYRHA